MGRPSVLDGLIEEELSDLRSQTLHLEGQLGERRLLGDDHGIQRLEHSLLVRQQDLELGHPLFKAHRRSLEPELPPSVKRLEQDQAPKVAFRPRLERIAASPRRIVRESWMVKLTNRTATPSLGALRAYPTLLVSRAVTQPTWRAARTKTRLSIHARLFGRSRAPENETPAIGRPMLLRAPHFKLDPQDELENTFDLRRNADAEARKTRTLAAQGRWQRMEMEAPEYLRHLSARQPKVVNDALLPGHDPAYELENCSFCAVGAVFGRSAGDIASMLPQGRRATQNPKAWSGGGSLSLDEQYAGITRFLIDNVRAEVENHTRDALSLSDGLDALSRYPNSTRFVLHMQDTHGDEHPERFGSHYLFGERFSGGLYIADFQTNVSEDAPPLLFRDEAPRAAHYGDFDQVCFWAVR